MKISNPHPWTHYTASSGSEKQFKAAVLVLPENPKSEERTTQQQLSVHIIMFDSYTHESIVEARRSSLDENKNLRNLLPLEKVYKK